jgi:soluble lytic murein transglycosylase
MRANSHVGAQGLMQIMPYTAKLVAKQAKLPYSKSRLTSDPEYNINLGSHYIAGLILNMMVPTLLLPPHIMPVLKELNTGKK